MKELLKTICLFILLLSLFGLLGIYIGSYSLNAIDALNLRHEARNRTDQADRTFYIKAVVDKEYMDIVAAKRDYGFFWENGSFRFIRSWEVEGFIEKLIERASKSFEYQFGIELVLTDIEVWEPTSRLSPFLIAELREKISLDNYDIVVAFSGRAADMISLGEYPRDGTLGNYTLVSLYLPEEIKWIGYVFNSYHLQSYVLVHELGHNFGALHPEDVHKLPDLPRIETVYDIYKLNDFFKKALEYFQKTFSVMNAATGYFTTHFDPYNKQIILENKHLPAK